MLKGECLKQISLATVPDGTNATSWDIGALLGGRATGINITAIGPGNSGGLKLAAAETLELALHKSTEQIPGDSDLTREQFSAIETAVREFFEAAGKAYTIPKFIENNQTECDMVVAALQKLVERELGGKAP